MENQKKQAELHKTDLLKEPATVYSSSKKEKTIDSEVTNPLLKKLLLQSIQDSKDGKGIPHEEMMIRVKLKYPLL
jgi:hypothetical protein